ncbi:MAG: HD superfamily phosphohydrolase [Bacteriovoracaceae bacterium]|jgi:HD superfamily phosphohydrolase
MEIRDPVHGSIHILKEEKPIIQHPFFQRLRNIKQLGFSDLIFPGATHNRFLHSIGVMFVGSKAFDTLFKERLNNKEVLKLKETFKLACLLHDIGHAPLSHSTETVMPQLSELKIPEQFLKGKDKLKDRQATHEDYTIKSIADSSFAESFKQVEDKFGVERVRIADVIVGHTNSSEYFTIDGVDYFPILHQLVSSELDCDRMDYLLRDSYFCGVSYGNYDLDWLIDNLETCVIDDRAFLGINERAVVTFDDFLLSRYHMFMMVYFHYRSVALEQLLYKYFASSPNEYTIPADIEAYVEHDDNLLMKTLHSSQNKYAKDLVQNKIPKKIYESFNESQLGTLNKVQEFLEHENIEHIRCSSLGRLSKYYTDDSPSDKFTMKVSRKLFKSKKKQYFNINDSTDLFQKFSNSHAVNRLHCDFDLLDEKKQQAILELIHTT